MAEGKKKISLVPKGGKASESEILASDTFDANYAPTEAAVGTPESKTGQGSGGKPPEDDISISETHKLPTLERPGAAAPPPKVVESTFKRGDEFGSYHILRLLGKAGFGELYLARHSLTRQRFAIKLLPKILARDLGFVKRFESMAEPFLSLDHPGIVKNKEGFCDKGYYGVVMDYVERLEGYPYSLENELNNFGRINEKEAKRIAVQLCDALHYAHKHRGGISHSDLKPENILFDVARNVKISNIGLVNLVGHDFFKRMLKLSISKRLTKVVEDPEDDGGEQRKDSGEALEDTASYVLLTQDQNINFLDFGHVKFIGSEYLRTLIKNSARLRPERGMAGSVDDGHASNGAADGLERANSIFSTYDYMSPEQKAGDEPDARSNVYSLGLIIYRMLTGKKMVGNWELPSHFGCERGWDKVIVRSLKTRPEERYQSIAQMRADIDRVGMRKYILATAAAAAVLALAVLAGVSFMMGRFGGVARPVEIELTDIDPRLATLPSAPDAKAAPVPSVLQLTLRVSPAGALVRLWDGGRLAAELPETPDESFELEVEPGRYQMEIVKPGFLESRQYLSLTEEGTVLGYRLAPAPPETSDSPTPEPGAPWMVPVLGLRMIPIPAGTRGAAAVEQPLWMSATEISQFQFDEVSQKRPSYFTLTWPDGPVERVTSADALEFCRTLTARERAAGRIGSDLEYRLPTAAEWEYCCAAGAEGTPYSFGNDLRQLGRHAWFLSNSGGKTNQVGILTPNAWGLHDMHGNVWEWCLPNNYQGKSEAALGRGMILKGGSVVVPPSMLVTSGSFAVDSPKFANSNTGFRIVLAPANPGAVPEK